MKKIALSILALFLISLASFAQNTTLITIGDKKISKNEFVKIYTKNNSKEISNDIKTVDEYLELFINFKLKVVEAEAMGLDTVKSYVTELDKYVSQLAKPYFTNPELQEQLYKEAYERLTQENRISYIFVQSRADATPEDTLKAYNKINDARKRIVKGEEFSLVAKEVSESRTVKKDGGDAWYVSALQSPYNIENYIYNAKVGDVSKPLKIPSGYFVVKITDKRPATGQINASHIMSSYKKGSSQADSLKAIKKLEEIQQKLKDGDKFEEVAKKYSDDKGSGAKGGELGWFGTGKMVREFETVAFSLQNIGDVSEPVQSMYGWHIIKLNDKKGFGTYEEKKEGIVKRVEKDERFKIVEKSVYNKIKKDGKFKTKNGIRNFYSNVDSTIFLGTWKSETLQNSKKVMFILDGTKYREGDFANYLISKQKKGRKIEISKHIDNEYQIYITELLTEFKIKHLSENDGEFKYIRNEYHDGLLLFEITDQIVWSKAVKDTTGLKNFYGKNKNKYYEKLNLEIYSYDNDATLEKAKKVLTEKANKNYSDLTVVEKVNIVGFNLVKSSVFKKGDDNTADFVFKKYEKNEITNEQLFVVDKQNNQIIYLNSNFRYVKGLVTADYQTELENIWLKELKKKYKVEVNKKVLEQVKQEVK